MWPVKKFMRIIKTISKLKNQIRKIKRGNKTIGFVPTMGYLHEGHLSLARASKKENSITVVSIFVNPLQFGPKEDFSKYPRDEARDIKLLKAENVDILFLPDIKELYPEGFKATVSVKDLSDVLCGASRPGHFDGVCTVVNKLFNIVEPDTAYFGQKDAQQLIIIKKMVNDLNMNVKIKGVPTVREKDGLAMSSRNAYMTKEERARAPILYESLLKAKEMIIKKTMDPNKIISAMRKMILKKIKYCRGVSRYARIKIDYIEIRDAKTLAKINTINSDTLIALAVGFGKARLIDNIIL